MDFSNLRSQQEIIELIDKSKTYIRDQPRASVITMTDITNMHFNNDIKDLFSAFVNGNKPFVKAG